MTVSGALSLVGEIVSYETLFRQSFVRGLRGCQPRDFLRHTQKCLPHFKTVALLDTLHIQRLHTCSVCRGVPMPWTRVWLMTMRPPLCLPRAGPQRGFALPGRPAEAPLRAQR